MPDHRELYQSVVLDHYKKPRNFGEVEGANAHAEGHNPLCGDRIRVSMLMEGDIVKDVRFRGTGCAISTASASMMTEALKGKSRADVEALFQRFHDLVATNEDREDAEKLGKLAVFSGVREFPMRVKCATLAWHTLRAAIGHDQQPVSTE